jgi:hypothetical protein
MPKLLERVAAVVAITLLLTGCVPAGGNGNGGGGFTVPPSPVPQSLTPAVVGPSGQVDVVFMVETFDQHVLPTVRDNVLMIVSAFSADGRMARYIDKVTGESLPGPQSYYRTTPWPYSATLGVGVVAAHVSGVLSPATRGEGIRCTVEVGGTPFPQLTVEKVVEVDYGAAQVTCLYSLPAGGFKPPM